LRNSLTSLSIHLWIGWIIAVPSTHGIHHDL
jgi:hypothetical protein